MNVHGKSSYHEVHARSLRDPEGFWAPGILDPKVFGVSSADSITDEKCDCDEKKVTLFETLFRDNAFTSKFEKAPLKV